MGAASGAGAAGAGAAGAGVAGATMFWLGAGFTPDVGRIATASDTTRAATPTMKIAATMLPTSPNDLRSRYSVSVVAAACSPV